MIFHYNCNRIIVNCAIVGCSNNSRKDVGSISFIGYQKIDMLKKTWLIKIGRDKSNLPKEDNIRICHVNFTFHGHSCSFFSRFL